MSSPSLKTSYTCPAKINIGLEVLFKRPDGYHELNTIFAKVGAPSDVIEVSAASEFTLTCSDRQLATDGSNLIMKAVNAFGAAAGISEVPALHLHLKKQIPTGAGLGGGSSDAAQAIHICNDHFGQILPLPELMEIASWVGADVPFFVSGYLAAIAGGIGERLEEFEIKHKYGLLIVKPEAISVPTAQAYSRLKVAKKVGTDIHDAISTHRWDMIANDFEQVIIEDNPQLAKIKSTMQEQGAFFASMSGSGSAIYGLFDSKLHAENAAKAFSLQELPCWASTLG